MVLGAPFTVEGVTYTPADTYNYDAVGYAAVGGEGGTAISLAHRTLPLPSYVEVTSLKTGKTILVRAERRGPMTGANLVELSPGAAAQLGLSGEKEPVRVRRVNPPEPERALLRMGQPAPERMETPMSLVSVLMRKLEPTVAAAPPVPPPSAVEPAKAPVVAKPAEKAKDADKPKVAAAPPPATAKPAPEPGPRPAPQKPKAAPSAKPAAKGAYAVQVATFSNPALATAAARKLGGAVSDAGKFHRVRITGFASAADAGAALAKAKAAGYSDARILRAD
jgi:rare lipoprotein A